MWFLTMHVCVCVDVTKNYDKACEVPFNIYCGSSGAAH